MNGTDSIQSNARAIHEGFTRFWAAYPRHIAKKDAIKAWIKIAPDAALIDKMLDALEWQRTSPDWRDVKFVPYPATWLRAERWEDEPPASLRTPWPYADWTCPHVPHCGHPTRCRTLVDLARYKASRAS